MKDSQDILDVERHLREIPIFKSLSQGRLSSLARDFVIRKVNKDEVIFYQSDSSTDLYIVLDGLVKACLLSEEGEELILTTFGKGSFFGEMSLLNGKPRSATMIAMRDSTLGRLKRERLLLSIKNDPMIAIELLSALVQRLRITDEMLGSLAFLDVSQRLLKLLMQIAKKEGEKDKNGFFRIKRLTHRQLASHIGASREAITKAVKVLVFRKLIREEEGCFLISPQAEEMLP
ncbi:MAG: Crp/Fnr family transcriptional regulator [Thermodesulfovibrionales bacterium]|nr:Crp/Fnr family transcriptional regulator [Thermodesulfovibrionales bacterium]